MDMSSHHKFTNWEQQHGLDHDHHDAPFEQPPSSSSQWPYYLQLHHHSDGSSPPGPLLGSPSLIGADQTASLLKGGDQEEDPEEELGAMKEMLFKIAAMQPVDVDPATIKKPRRRNVRISDDPQSVAARHRRERISEKIRILQRLVPGGTKMDTASMLDEAIRYVKFLKRQIRTLQGVQQPCLGIPCTTTSAADDNWEVAVTTKAAAATATTSFVFGGNNEDDDHCDDPMCFNHKFIGN